MEKYATIITEKAFHGLRNVLQILENSQENNCGGVLF